MKQVEPDMNTDQLAGHYKKHTDRTYIGSHDLMLEDGTFRTAKVQITGTHKRQIYNTGKKKHESRVICTLKGADKAFIANATNLKAIEQIAQTPMIDKWVGVDILLTVQKVKVGKEMVDAIRVAPIK